MTVDAVDRKLLGLLAEDAMLPYAELGRRMNLSPPAVHERVKRLKETGVIRPEVEEIHAVTGDACLILKVRTAGPAALEDLLAHVYAVPGVRATRSYVALRTHLERGMPAAIRLDGRDAYPEPTPLETSPAPSPP